jgi:glutamate-1-semialdehyde 2,1-aminomutase
MSTNLGPELWEKTKKIIPGGAQLLSKRSEQFLPGYWPSYYQKAKGVEVLDLNGNKFIDMSLMGVGACPLGYADPDVDGAVKEAIDKGSMCTLNCAEEVELAELLLKLHPKMEMVRYARCGGEAMAIAVRLARARTGKDIIAFCGYHGWHDWYLAANLSEASNLDGHLLPGLDPKGVPRGLTGTSIPFRYNHIEDLEDIIEKRGDKLAAIVMEPIRNHDPEPDFIKRIHEIIDEYNLVLIVDEVSSGFRLTTGGAYPLYNFHPDIAVFAKAMSNGYPMAAIVGESDVMKAAQDTFISSTYWTERIGPTAAIATIQKYLKYNVSDHLVRMGKLVQKGWIDAADTAGLSIEVDGIPPLSHISFTDRQDNVIPTLFTQMMLDSGFLAGRSFYASFSHNESHVTSYLDAVQATFSKMSEIIRLGEEDKMLKGMAAYSGFKRLT